ncbi:MAG: MBL fold metallo-hydrolase [Gammaproteobacteria bacterium]|nr:MBL fold metallo-hydrolase [Gammaproteobacteria bacterium]
MQYQEFTDLGHGITCIDTMQHRAGLAACYLIEHQGHAALIDTGHSLCTPRILALLEQKGIALKDVDYVMPTHVHLDHAGGAGNLMQALPNAKLIMHPRGARHMADPSKLIAGATAVYGAEGLKQQFGEILATDAERIISIEDGDSFSLAGRQLEIRDTPGHAKHHYAVWDAVSRGWFTGDTFGISYRETDATACGSTQQHYLIPTSTPVQFDPEAWNNTIDMLMSYKPERMFLTHFGMVEDVASLSIELKRKLHEYVLLTRRHGLAENAHTLLKGALKQLHTDDLARLGAQLSAEQVEQIYAVDLELNTQGLLFWLEHAA